MSALIFRGLLIFPWFCNRLTWVQYLSAFGKLVSIADDAKWLGSWIYKNPVDAISSSLLLVANNFADVVSKPSTVISLPCSPAAVGRRWNKPGWLLPQINRGSIRGCAVEACSGPPALPHPFARRRVTDKLHLPEAEKGLMSLDL